MLGKTPTETNTYATIFQVHFYYISSKIKIRLFQNKSLALSSAVNQARALKIAASDSETYALANLCPIALVNFRKPDEKHIENKIETMTQNCAVAL